MKIRIKYLLAILLCGIFATTNAQTTITETPDGKISKYSLNSKLAYNRVMNSIFPSSIRDAIVEFVEGSDGNFYIKDPIPVQTLNTWIKGKKNSDESISFEFPQYLGSKSLMFQGTVEFYIRMAKPVFKDDGSLDRMEILDTKTFTLVKNEEGSYEPADKDIALVYTNEKGDEWTGYGMTQFNYSYLPEFVVLPEDAVISDYVVMHDDIYTRGEGTKIKIATSGNDIYFGGFPGIDNMWAKGTLSGNILTGQKLTMDCCQTMGQDSLTKKLVTFHVGSFFLDSIAGQEVQGIRAKESITFNVSGLKDKIFTIESDSLGFFIENLGLKTFCNPILWPQSHADIIIDNPMNPVWEFVTDWDTHSLKRQLKFHIPVRNKDENKVLDTETLYYNIYLDDNETPYEYSVEQYDIEESMTDIPWSFTTLETLDFMLNRTQHVIFLREKDIYRVGVQSICRVGDEERRSDIVWCDVPDAPSSVDTILNELDDVVSTEYYDMMGRRVKAPQQGGIYVRRRTLANGKIITDKLIQR